ncbi:hypothetical protein MSPP1_002845 [Malassezia sp. CBS 17886]|nr:hypothetical protein MSPP1_002845 [Malassezia sp. CBS 17886]
MRAAVLTASLCPDTRAPPPAGDVHAACDGFSDFLAARAGRGARAEKAPLALRVEARTPATPPHGAPWRGVPRLADTVRALLLDDGPPPDTLQAVYRGVDDACRVSDGQAAALAQQTQAHLKRCMEVLVERQLAGRDADDAEDAVAWVLALRALWLDVGVRLHVVERLLSPLLRSAWCERETGAGLPAGEAPPAAATLAAAAPPPAAPLAAVCFGHLRQQIRHVLRSDGIIARGVETLAERVRSSGTDDDAAHTALRDVLDLGDALDMRAMLSAVLARHAHAFYAALASSLYAAPSPAARAANVPRIARCIARERAWAPLMYSSAATRAEMEHVAETHLVDGHRADLIALLPHLLDTRDDAVLAPLYALLAAPRDDVCAALRAYVRARGTRLVEDRANDSTMIERLLAFQKEMHERWTASFASDPVVQHAVRDSFEVFVNARGLRPAELLATFIDGKLRAGNKIMSDDALDALMDEVLSLFRFVRDKDMFEEFYKRGFAKRLLLNRSASDDAERAMLLRLKLECGPDFTAKLETMLKDMQVSEGLGAAFRARSAAGGLAANAPPFDFDVSVLTNAHWPAFPDVGVALPRAMTDAIARFEQFYHTCHSGRTLHWRHALGVLVVTADLGRAGVRELHVSTFQGAALFVFNRVRPGERVPYARILAETQLPPAELKRTLQSLACGTIPTRVLRKHPQGRDVADTDEFSVNEALKNDRRRIRINQIQHAETVRRRRAPAYLQPDEQRSTEHRVLIDRELVLQAHAMRILKARKTIRHADLTTAVVDQIKNRFSVDAGELKKAFERLIEKDCMERVEGERGVYRYVA